MGVRTTDHVAGAAHDERAAGGVAHRPGVGPGREVHPLHRPGPVEGQHVGALRLEPGEVQSAVEDRGAGGEHEVVGRQRLAALEADGRPPALRDRSHAVALVQGAAVRAQLLRERREDVHGVELGLVGERRRGHVREGHVEGVSPLDGQAERRGGLVLLLDRRALLLVGGVRHRGAALVGHGVVVAEPQQPLHALAVGVDVGRRDLLGLVAADAGQVRALEQRDLAGGAAGGDRADVAGLDARDPQPGAGEQEAGRQAGQPGPHDDGVQGLPGAGQRVVGDRRRPVEPERGHDSSSSSSWVVRRLSGTRLGVHRVGVEVGLRVGPGLLRPVVGRTHLFLLGGVRGVS